MRGSSSPSPLRVVLKFAAALGYGTFIAAALCSPAIHAQVIAPTPTATPTPVDSNLTVKPATTRFGAQLVLPPNGISGKAKNITLSVARGQPAPVTIESIMTSNSVEFAIQPNQCGTISPGGSCTVPVVFTPSQLGGRSSLLVVTSNAADPVESVQLVGNGRQGVLTLKPRPLSFGTIDVGTHSDTKTVTLINNNALPLSIFQITTSNQAVFPFFIEQNNCRTVLAPNGGSCTLEIFFAPQANGTFSGTFFINDNAAGNPQPIRLSGSGKNGPRPTRTATATASPTPTFTPIPGTLPMRSVPVLQ